MEDISVLFPQFEPELLNEIITHGVIKTFPAGELMMRTGQFIKSTMLILDGSVKIFRENEDGGEFLMYYLQPGEACAISIICAAKAEASRVMAKTVEETTVLMVPLQLIDRWMIEYKTWYHFVLSTYRNRFDELLNLIDQVAFRNMDERLLFYLQRHVKINNVHTIALSHQQIAEELNVIDLEDIASADGELVDISIKANFRTLGTKFGGAVQEIAKAISAQNPAELVTTLRASASTKVEQWEITLDDLVVTETPKSGWNVASHDGESVALDLALSPALIAAGLVREVIRFIQDARKTSGFDISDRINVSYNAGDEVMAAISGDLQHIQSEVLATQMLEDKSLQLAENELGLTVKLVKNAN